MRWLRVRVANTMLSPFSNRRPGSATNRRFFTVYSALMFFGLIPITLLILCNLRIVNPRLLVQQWFLWCMIVSIVASAAVATYSVSNKLQQVKNRRGRQQASGRVYAGVILPRLVVFAGVSTILLVWGAASKRNAQLLLDFDPICDRLSQLIAADGESADLRKDSSPAERSASDCRVPDGRSHCTLLLFVLEQSRFARIRSVACARCVNCCRNCAENSSARVWC